MPNVVSQSKQNEPPSSAATPVYWRVEGSLLELSALRQVGFFTWNSQSFSERWKRRAGMAAMVLLRPFAYIAGRTFATRLLYTLLRGVTRDRLDLLGEEYFEYALKPGLRKEGIAALERARESGLQIVLFGESLDHVLRPLAKHLGVGQFIGNRMEFRDGVATGRLMKPVVHPRGPFAWIAGESDGSVAERRLLTELDLQDGGQLRSAAQFAGRGLAMQPPSVVPFDGAPAVPGLSVRRAL